MSILVLIAQTIDAQNRGAPNTRYNGGGQSRTGRQQLDMSVNIGGCLGSADTTMNSENHIIDRNVESLIISFAVL